MTDRETRAGATERIEPVDRRQRRHDGKKARILAEAWDLARRDGLAGISLRELADRVDLRQPSLYAYFESKLDLYDALFADGNRQLLDVVSARVPLDDPREELIEYLELLVRLASEDPERHQLLFQRTIPGFEPSPASYALALEFFQTGIDRIRAAGVSDASEMDVFTALISGLAHQQIANDPGGDRWVRVARRVAEMFLDDIERRRRSSDDDEAKRGDR
jgi:AcrR family transcriptional regulator